MWILNTLPVRAKVKVNYSLILLPLQGVGAYTLIPRPLPWTGCPFRALLFALCSFIMCACFATFYLAQNRAEIFLYFEHPTREGNKMFVAFLFMPRGKMLSGGRHRLMFYPPQPPDDERKPTMPLFPCLSEGVRVCSFLSLSYRILSFCPTAMGPPSGMPLFL